MNPNDYQQLEQYLAGELSPAEHAALAERLRREPALAAEAEELQQLRRSFAHYGRRQALRLKLDTFHAEMAADTSVEERTRGYAFRKLWRKHLHTMAIAASVAVFTVFSTLLTIDYLRSLEHRQISQYQQLAKEQNQIKKTLRDINKAVDQNAIPASAPVQISYSATGFALSSNGYLITNYHVVRQADSVYVETTGDRPHRYSAQVVYTQPDYDLAVLKINDSRFTGLGRLPYALANREADLGEPVYTLAYPREDMVYGEGSVSSRSGFEGDTTDYQVSIPVNPGNSGSPLLDSRGNLLGIITGKNTEVDGAAFAIKGRYLKEMLSQIPAGTLPEPLVLSRKSSLNGLKRSEQIKKLQPFVFNVKVYNR